MNGFSTGSGEEDSRDSKGGNHDQLCCLIDVGERCTRTAGNASYSKRIQKTVQQRKLRLHMDSSVIFFFIQTFDNHKHFTFIYLMFNKFLNIPYIIFRQGTYTSVTITRD